MHKHSVPSDTQKQLLSSSKSALDKYGELVIGKRGLVPLIRYEVISLLSSWIPGALGLVLRGRMYRWLLGAVGENVVFGTGVILRHPHKIFLGNNVVVDDNCVLDAKGESNRGIVIDDNVFVGRNTLVYCQNGNIEIGRNTNIGSNCQIFSANDVKVGKDTLIGAYSYLVGGGHIASDTSVPINQQGRYANGIELGEDIWVGAGVTILDGVAVGTGAIIGAGAVVKEQVPPYTIVGGVPAKVLGNRMMNKTVPE